MKTSVIAVLLLVILGGAAYWLEKSGLVPSSWTQMVTFGQTATGQRQTVPGAQQGNRGPVPVEVAAAHRARLSDDIAGIGNLLADESVDIAPETSGRIAEILFKDGQTVEAGAELFKLDAALTDAALAEANSRFNLAQANFTRNQTLRKSGNVAQSAFESSQTDFQVAR